MSKVVLITGATSGIGKALTEKFVSIGWRVLALARDINKINLMEKKLGEKFEGLSLDIQKPMEVSNLFNSLENKYDSIDLLINNAAIFKMDKFENCSFDDIDSLVDTNLKGAMYCTLKTIKYMKKRKIHGRIINIASVASTHGIENQAIYCASKYGLNGFAESLNQELIKENISITTIYPGGVQTPLWNENNQYPGNLDKILKPSDIVELVEYIADLNPRVILKNLTIFPSNEWH